MVVFGREYVTTYCWRLGVPTRFLLIKGFLGAKHDQKITCVYECLFKSSIGTQQRVMEAFD